MEPLKEPLIETQMTLRNYAAHIYPILELGHFGIFRRDNQALIGMAALFYGQDAYQDCVQLGYLIDRRYRNFGYALWACQALISYAKEAGHSKLICLIRPENYQSCRLAMRLGFQKQEQVLYQFHIHNLYLLQLDEGKE